MWLLIFLSILVSLVITWTMFGYFVFLFFLGLFRRDSRLKEPAQWPSFSIIIPCLNEADTIVRKLENVRALDYPRELLEVVFADGGSEDGTVALLREALDEDEPVRVVECPRRGKIAQLNHVLPQLKGEIVVNTDVDALMCSDALRQMAREFEDNPRMGVVGAYCSPDDTLPIEFYHWDSQNKSRLLETDARSSSIVVAPCYAFRRELLDRFPDDVVADDIFIAFHAHALHYRVVYSRHARAIETRSAQGMEEFIPHKFRKSNAFLRETLRFLYLLPEMGPMCRMMLLTRIMQQLLLPWLLLFWFLLAGSLLTLFRWDIVCINTAGIVISFFLTSKIFRLTRIPEMGHCENRKSLALAIEGFCVTIMIMLVTGLTYPFVRQGSVYKRLGNDGS